MPISESKLVAEWLKGNTTYIRSDKNKPNKDSDN